jgi:DNA-binding transcriptional ArsR family regulator
MAIRKRGQSVVDSTPLARHAAEVLKAVAHPLRIRIVGALCGRSQNVGELAERLGAPQAIVSQQLRILRMRGLVGVTRENGHALYWIAEPHLHDMIRCVSGCVSGKRGST